jgi:integrase
VKRGLSGFFGADCDLRNVTAARAEDFRLHLVGKRLAASTIAKRLQRARQMFTAARRRKLIHENPFAETRHGEGDPSER